MGCSGLLILVLVPNVAHCLEILGLGGEPHLDIPHNITAVLGEDVYLWCRYMGDSDILSATWKRQINTKVKSRPLAGFTNDKPFSRSDFSEPESVTNLTVKMNVSSVDAEGEYICEFESEEESYSDRVFLTVVARPEIQIQLSAETINGSHYQSVSCSAVGGRPMSKISWLVDDLPSPDHPLTQQTIETFHSNGTSTVSNTLRFPTHLQDQDSVVCIVQHPTLPSPSLTTVRVETYTRPNVTVKAEMVQRGGSDFWVVSCISSGGRPDTDISLSLSGEEEQQREDSTDSDTQTSSVLLPAYLYEGHNVTCLFDHPKFKQRVSRVITLPSFYISGVQVLYSELQSNYHNFEDFQTVELQEGQSNIVISLQLIGNVPRYNVSCKKDNGALPDGVEIIGSYLTLQGPMERQHAGVFECFFSYHHLQTNLTFNVTVKPPVIKPVPPAVQVDVQTKDGRRVIECSAADAVPAANVSWLLPEGVSGVSWFNFTSHNGSHSVREVLLLPACSPRELSAVCVINHPAFKEPQNRSITLPLCARPNITINSSTEWKNGDKYMNVHCSVDSVATAASITWHVGATESSISPLLETSVHSEGSVSFRSSVHFMASLYSGHNLTCMVEHPSLEAAEKRTIGILVHKAPQLSVSVVRQQDSLLAVCDCRGEGVGANLAWVLPENVKEQTSLHLESEGQVLKARLTYQFQLALHEGQNLTCLYHFKHGATEKKTIHIPRYYISSLRVLNCTAPLKSRYRVEPTVQRLALQENRQNQRVLLQVKGNVPEYNLNCKRSDGSVVQMHGAAMVFPSELTERDEGLYTCQASFYHHTATVNIQVEVMSQDKLLALVTMICISSASAILLILLVTLWVFCSKRSSTPQYKKRESLSALTTLMQEPSSPDPKKPPVTEKDSKEYAQLISYSIVIDVKSNV